MGSRSKIVGINREEAESASDAEEKAIALGSEEDNAEELLLSSHEPAEEEYYPEEFEPASKRDWKTTAAASAIILVFALWTGFFLWINQDVFSQPANGGQAISLIGDWALPAAFLGVLWLLLMRNSRSEALRFADAGEKLRAESEALETRMRTVNEEIALAREFLAQNAQDLESVGRQSAENLTAAAEQLASALADSDEKAKRLEEVSNAATSNLEQLRKHLPVVTSAAKDVTNQIGGAGNSAQVQVKSLINALRKMNEAGEVARESIDGLEEDAVRAADHISEKIGASSKLFSENMNAADTAADGLQEKFTEITATSNRAVEDATERLSALFEQSSTEFADKMRSIAEEFEQNNERIRTAFTQSADEVNALLEQSGGKLTSQLSEMTEAVENIRGTVDAQDDRVDGLVSRISSLIEESMAQIEQLDSNATDKTATLAFAIESLVHSTRELDESIGQTNGSAASLVETSEKILADFSNAKTEIEDILPAAIQRLDDNFSSGFENLEKAHAMAGEIDTHSDNLLARLTTIDDLIARQQDALATLMVSGDEQLTSYSEQAQALSESLASTQSLVEETARQTDEKLVTSLKELKVTTEETAKQSKQLIDEQLDGVATKLSSQNRDLLAKAVDDQLGVLNTHMQDVIGKQLDLSEEATKKLSGQLAQIDEMTANLEARLQDTHDGFGGLDHEGFARRMALLTESLNSTAIDVAKILSNEVTDTAWSAYLKGDRGVFTRRAVRLLDSGEARAIAEHYDTDPEFAEHVNRYIHDFEAMMRVLLSTRDGNAIGVTLLSSDVGKLYVALAQAIERLRN